MSKRGEKRTSTYGMCCDVHVTRRCVRARRVGDACRMRIGRMVKLGVGRGVMMRNQGGSVLVLVAGAHMTAGVRTPAP